MRMADVRLVFLENLGEYKRGEVNLVPLGTANGYVQSGKAVYYGDFSSSMLEEEKGKESVEKPKKKASKKD